MFDIRLSTKFKIAILLEIVIFLGIIWWGYSNISGESQKIINVGSTIASLVIVLLTTSLVYSKLRQPPEMAFIGFLVEPMSEKDEHVATQVSHPKIKTTIVGLHASKISAICWS